MCLGVYIHYTEISHCDKEETAESSCVPETGQNTERSTKPAHVPPEMEEEPEVTCVPETDSEDEWIPATPQKKSMKSIAFDDLEIKSTMHIYCHSTVPHTCDTGMIV